MRAVRLNFEALELLGVATMAENGHEISLDSEVFTRRSALKKAAGAGVAAGLVWSAPKIEGLTLRPNYAAAMTAGGSFMFDATPGMNGGSTVAICPGAGPNGSQQGSLQFSYQLFANNANVKIRVRTPFGDARADQVTFSPSSFLPGGLTGGGAGGFSAAGTPALLDQNTKVTVFYNCA